MKKTKSTKRAAAPAAEQTSGGEIPKTLSTPAFAAAWDGWVEFLAERGAALTKEDKIRQLALLRKMTPEEAILDIRRTMETHPLAGDSFVASHKARVAKEAAAAPAPNKNGGKRSAEKMMSAAELAEHTADILPMKAPAPAPADVPAKTKPTPKPRATTAPLGAKKVSALDAAAKVLLEVAKPLGCVEMIAEMTARGYWTSPGGKTPHATLYSAILREIGAKGAASRFAKDGPGKFSAKEVPHAAR